MEKKNLASILKNKKILLAGGISVIIVLIPLVMLLEAKDQTKKQQSDPNITNVPTKSVEVTEQKPVVKWQPYENEEFSMQYPPEWRAKDYRTQTGDLTIIIKPTILPESLTYPQFIVQMQHNAANAIQNKRGILEGLKMEQSKTKVNNVEALLYTGTIPFKTKGGATVREPVQDTTVLYQDGNTLYTFKYEYEGESKDEKLETFFASFIDTFKTSN